VLPGASPAEAAVEALYRESLAPAKAWKPGDLWWWVRATSAAPVALLTALGNLLVHGLALLVMRRFGLGLAILGVEAAVLAALFYELAPSGVAFLLLGTLAASLWWPTQILIRRRTRLSLRLGSLYGGLLILLYIESALSLFFLLHGVAHRFAGHPRIARVLSWLQIFSVGCFGLYLVDRRALELTRVGGFYFWTAIALWFGTWLWEIIAVARRDLIRPHAQISRQRRYDVYTHLLTNPAAVESVMKYAAGADPSRRRWAVTVLRRNGDRVPPEYWVRVLKERGTDTPDFVDLALRQARREETIREVQALWSQARPALRDRIFNILARKPNECSLEYLRNIRSQLGLGKRIRCLAAEIEFRLALVPAMVWIAVGLLAPMAFSLAWHGLQYGRQPSRLLRDFVTSRKAQESDPQRVLRFGRFISEERPLEIDEAFARSVGRVARIGADSLNWDLRIPAVDLLARLIQNVPHQNPKVSATARQLAESHLDDMVALLGAPVFVPPADLVRRQQILQTLELIGSPAAVNALKDFVVRTSSALAPDRAYIGGTKAQAGEFLPSGEMVTLQSEAMRVVARIGSPEAVTALQELSSSPGLAGREAMPAVVLDILRGAYGRGEYERVVSQGTEILPLFDAGRDRGLGGDLLVLLGKAKLQLAIAADSDPARATALEREAVAYVEKAEALRPLDAEARGVLASSYERMAARLIAADDLNGAADYVARALKADPSSAYALGTRGALLKRRNDLTGAAAAFAEAARINPRYVWAIAMQASIALEQRRYAESAEAAARAIEADPDYPWSYALLGQAYHEQGKDRDAIARFETLRRKYPDNPLPLQAQMYVYHEQLSSQDPSAYDQNYALYQEIQKDVYKAKISKPDDVEAGLIEAELTTGRYRDAARRSWKFLAGTAARPNARLIVPVRAVLYAALALSGDTVQAAAELENLRVALRALPRDYVGEWTYNGSIHYVRSSSLADPLRSSVAGLLQAIHDKPVAVPDSVFEDNRRALSSYPARPSKP
jgi:tetratricopeptide (TPR) repeat protein